jgi:tetratricopeptide (TPR) repeat protein
MQEGSEMGKAFADRWGVPVRAGSAGAVALLDEAIEDLAALAGDPVADADVAVAADDSLVLGHIYRAYLQLYGTTPEGVAAAGEILKRLDETAMGERELHHLHAARHWVEGNWEATTRSLERALLCHPRDLLALKVAQDLYFFLGNRLELRDTAARVLPAWPRSRPGWGYVQGIYAFGLEENADYRQAEARARAALEHNPKDVWSVHALAHVFEMEGSQRNGVDFLVASAPDWSASFFAIHNWWHRGLYHLELGEIDEALGLYDGPIRAGRSTEWLDVVDAAALLWRLSLFGADVTGRAEQLAADIDDLVGSPVYIFNDWHAVMAFGLAGDLRRTERVIASNRHLTAPTNAGAAGRAGLALLEAFAAFATGRPDRAIDLLIDIRPRASAVGGSHAQRDIIDLTLIAAAARAGDDALARALITERAARKPTAEAAARKLIAENGGSSDALRW